MAVFTDEGKTYHVRVGKGDIGRYVLLPGDPDRHAQRHSRLRRLHRHGLPVHRDLPGRADRLRRGHLHPRRHGRTRLRPRVRPDA